MLPFLLNLSQNITIAIADSTAFSTLDNRAAIYGRQDTDSISVSDALTSIHTAHFIFNETLSTSDIVTRSFILYRITLDTTGFADLIARSMVSARLLSNVLSSADSDARITVISRNFSETVTGSDLLFKQTSFVRSEAETITVSDSYVRSVLQARAVAESDIFQSDYVIRNTSSYRSEQDNLTGNSDYFGTIPGGSISGYVKDTGGAPVVGVTVDLFRQSDRYYIATTTTDSNGFYSFSRYHDDPNVYYTLGYINSSPQKHGVSDRGLTAV